MSIPDPDIKQAESLGHENRVSAPVEPRTSTLVAKDRRARYFKAASFGAEKRKRDISISKQTDLKMSTFKKKPNRTLEVPGDSKREDKNKFTKKRSAFATGLF